MFNINNIEFMSIYKNGNYLVTILNDGTKIRQTKDDEFIPAFAENCDCKITDKCSQGCAFCYEGCTANGKHGDLFKYPFINTLHAYTELALNGNDLDHPDIEKFLEFLKEKKVFANITVNQNQFFANYDRIKDWQEKKMVYGIGVSLQNATDELIEKMNSIPNTVLHTIVGILSEDDIMKLKDHGIKILLLGYKQLQRGVNYLNSHNDEVNKNKQYVYDNLGDITNWFKVVSFDNLAIEQLGVKRIVPANEWDGLYMGDDGGYTFYIDMVKGEFSKNSIAQDRYPIGEKTIDEMFKFIQEHCK